MIEQVADGCPRIVYAFHSPFAGGAEIQQVRRLINMRDYGIEPVAVFPRGGSDLPQSRHVLTLLKSAGVRVDELPYRHFVSLDEFDPTDEPPDYDEIRQYLLDARPALVHSVTLLPAFAKACRQLEIAHVTNLHGLPAEAQAPAPEHTLNPHCQVVISDSIHYLNQWRRLLQVKGVCARGTVPQSLFEQGRRRIKDSAEWTDRRVRIVLAGTFQPRKHQYEAIEAVGALVARGRDVQLDLYGHLEFAPEYVAQCRARARQLGIEDRTAFLGFTPDLEQLYQAADIILCASTFESLPSTIKEASAAGVLIVSTPVGGVPEVVIDGVTGILCEGFDAAHIADGLQQAVELPSHERAAMVQRAHASAHSDVHPSRSASDLLSAYVYALAALHRGRDQRRRHHGPPAKEEPPARHYPPLGSALLQNRLVYRVTCDVSDWEGLGVIVGTHRTANASGTILLRLYDANQRLVREALSTLYGVQDVTWMRFAFERIADSKDQTYQAEFFLVGAETGTRISLFEATPPPDSLVGKLLRRVRGEQVRDRLTARLYFATGSA